MTTLTIRDFRTRPRQAQDDLAKAGEAMLTSNGRPVALMIPVNAGSLDATLGMVRRARALHALQRLRESAKSSGTDRMSMGVIDQVITESRKSRKRKRP